ncbi:MAG: hypothetical protein GPJ54_20965 [Candidatus Heimdallarchaeota archaeon]|nr:hypothetical protein [Candidatus Heimdallarchaeota archaeon]
MVQKIPAHVDDPHPEESDSSSSISIRLFLFVNLIIISLSLGLVILVNQYQQNVKYVSPKTMITIILSTLLINAIVAVNTYVEVK